MRTVEFFETVPVKFCKNFQIALKMTCMENFANFSENLTKNVMQLVKCVSKFDQGYFHDPGT